MSSSSLENPAQKPLFMFLHLLRQEKRIEYGRSCVGLLKLLPRSDVPHVPLIFHCQWQVSWPHLTFKRVEMCSLSLYRECDSSKSLWAEVWKGSILICGNVTLEVCISGKFSSKGIGSLGLHLDRIQGQRSSIGKFPRKGHRTSHRSK